MTSDDDIMLSSGAKEPARKRPSKTRTGLVRRASFHALGSQPREQNFRSLVSVAVEFYSGRIRR